MGGTFAQWQPRYAEHGIATFPVENKRPCVRHWQKIGLKGSTQLAVKFADADAFGFRCGKYSRLTVIDIDSHDERMVDEAERLFGSSPILWRTGSGNFAMPFRYNGEARRIRPVPGLPIDILGGGFAVAPPSMGAKGRYQFLHGGLPDLDRLPRLRVDKIAPSETPQHTHHDIAIGRRNNTLWRYAMEQARHVDDLDALIDVVRTRNMDCETPLPAPEITTIASSAWRHEQQGTNLIGRGRAIVTPHAVIDGLMQEHPDAFLLRMLLQRHHWGRDFVMANAMAATMPGGGWTLRRFVAARKMLVRLGLVQLVQRATQRRPSIWRLCQKRSPQKAREEAERGMSISYW